MVKVLIATKNPSKFNQIYNLIEDFDGFSFCSLKDLDIEGDVEEGGLTVRENALKKADFYARISKLPTLATDKAAYIRGLPSEKQPGVLARRASRDTSDEGLLKFYLGLLRGLSENEREADFVWGICLALPNGSCYYDEYTENVQFVLEPKLPIKTPGYPVDSIIFSKRFSKYKCDLGVFEQQQIDIELSRVIRKLLMNI